MQYRRLSDSELNVSVLAFGAWQLAHDAYWGADADADPVGAVHKAVEIGVNLFDTAEMYNEGESERVLGQALKGIRDKVYIASKVSPDHLHPVAVRNACETSLKNLDTDWIDLYQVHWPSREVPFDDTYGALLQLKEEGKIREIGLSNFGTEDLGRWCSIGSAVSNQLCYNLLFRAIEYDIVPECVKRNIGILAYMPLMQGILSGRWDSVEVIPQKRRRTRHFAPDREGVMHTEPGCERETMDTVRELNVIADDLGETSATVAMAWLIAQPGVSSVVAGARKPAQVERNHRAATLHLPEKTITRLDEASAALKKRLGANADAWLCDQKARIR